MRNVIVYVISTVVLIFIGMCILGATSIKIETNVVIGITGIVSALNLIAIFKIYAWFLFWDSVIPRMTPEKISELEKENPET